ncbi:MAG: hypothetical protein R3E61_08635 [Pseudomonadales bacterium]
MQTVAAILKLEVWWYSKPIDYQYRAFFHTTSSTELLKEEGQIDRYGVGAEQRDQMNEVAYRNTAEVNRSYAHPMQIWV